MLSLFAALVLLLRALSCYAKLTNVTVDDSDTSISYSPDWRISEIENGLNYGGYHHLTNIYHASAIFKFTGVSVFFLAPLWPYRVAAVVVLDGNLSSVIDLQDHRFSENHDGGPESDTSAVRWGASGLANVEHVLLITFSERSDWLVLDALQFTQDDGVDDSSSSSSPSPSPSSSSSSSTPSSTFSDSSATGTSTPSSSESSASVNVAIIVGPVVGVIALLAGLLAFFLCFRRRRRQRMQPREIDGVTWAEPEVKRSGWLSMFKKHPDPESQKEKPLSPNLIMEPFQEQPLANPRIPAPSTGTRSDSYASQSLYPEHMSFHRPHPSLSTLTSQTASGSMPSQVRAAKSGYIISNLAEPVSRQESDDEGEELPPSYNSHAEGPLQHPQDRKH